MRTKRQNVSNNLNVLFILTITFIALCLFVPVWQSAISSQLRRGLYRAEAELEVKEEQMMTLQASVAQQNTPEYVLGEGNVKNIAFSRISSDSTSAVASSL